MRRLCVTMSLALGVAFSGTALAQDEMGTEPTMDPPASDPTMDSAGVIAGDYPMEEVLRPINLRSGMVEAGADIGVFKAPDFGDAIGLIVRGDYAVNDQLQVGLRIPLAMAKPDGLESLAGIWLNGLYALHENVSARLDLGFVHLGGAAGLFPFAPPLYFDGDGMKLAFRLGATYKKAFNEKLALVVDPGLLFQLDGAAGDNGEAEMFQSLLIPVSLWYQLSSELALAFNTGVFSGHKFKFSGDDGMAVPVYLTAQYTMMDNHLDLGANIGLGNVTPGEGGSAGDSLFLGLFANYRL